MAVHLHYFECASHEEEAARDLNRRIMSLKFAYAGSASATHQKLSNSGGYRSVNWSIQGEFVAVRSLIGATPCDIIEFGPGDGRHTASLLSALRDADAGISSYTGVDFSRTLFMAARPIIQRAVAPASLSFVPADLEREPARAISLAKHSRTLFIVLGGLFANVEDPLVTASNVRKTLPSACGGVVSVPALVSGGDEALRPYQTDVFRKAAIEPVLALGIPESNVRFELRWDESQTAVVGEVHMMRDWHPETVTAPPLARGEVIRCFISRRFAAIDLVNVLASAGFVATGNPTVEGTGALVVTVETAS